MPTNCCGLLKGEEITPLPHMASPRPTITLLVPSRVTVYYTNSFSFFSVGALFSQDSNAVQS
jgi:hypothetical protein